jgi:hypothetical protein
VRTLEPIQDKKDVITETDAIDSVSRSKVDVRTIKKNSYQIRNKATVPSISGYRAKKLIDIDKKEDMEEELKKKQASKFSPFLLYPMDENQKRSVTSSKLAIKSPTICCRWSISYSQNI